MSRKEYSLYKRKIKLEDGENGEKRTTYRWYVQFKDAKGTYQSGLSTHEENREAAIAWIERKIAESGAGKQAREIIFKQFTFNIFNDDSDFMRYRESLGKRWTKQYRHQHEQNLKNLILPFFGDLYISRIDSSTIADWHVKYSGVSPNMRNYSLQTSNQIFRYAMTKKIIKINPLIGLDKPAPRHRIRGSFTIEEIKKLFNESVISSVWNNNITIYTVALLSASCGLRLGEILALRRCDVRMDYLNIEHSFSKIDGLKSTKNKKSRIVPLPERAGRFIDILTNLSPYKNDDDYLFHSSQRDIPIRQDQIRDTLYQALSIIGIDEKMRSEKNLSFHSFRHFFNSVALQKLPGILVQRLLGHQSDKMSSNYFHDDVIKNQALIDFQNEII